MSEYAECYLILLRALLTFEPSEVISGRTGLFVLEQRRRRGGSLSLRHSARVLPEHRTIRRRGQGWDGGWEHDRRCVA